MFQLKPFNKTSGNFPAFSRRHNGIIQVESTTSAELAPFNSTMSKFVPENKTRLNHENTPTNPSPLSSLPAFGSSRALPPLRLGFKIVSRYSYPLLTDFFPSTDSVQSLCIMCLVRKFLFL